jgi:hypothetical protein
MSLGPALSIIMALDWESAHPLKKPVISLIQLILRFNIITQMKLEHQNKSYSFLLEFAFGGAAAFISKSIASPI